jgi:large subunit ribosomal protein L10
MPTLAKKQDFASQLQKNIEGANIILVADYRGLSVAEITELRRILRVDNVKMVVAKNTLAKRIFAGTEVEALASHLKGPTALLLGYGDQVAAVKQIKDYLKKNKKQNELRAAFLDGTVLNAVAVDDLANLPSFDQLRGKLLMCIAHPVAGLAGVLNANNASLVRALDQIGSQKQGAA